MDELLPKPKEARKGFNYSILVLILVVILGLTLPFHYVPDQLKAFPKDNLTFKNTFISTSVLENIINRYNQAGLLEKVQLRNDPFIKTLLQEGIIKNETPVTASETLNEPEPETQTSYKGSQFDPFGYYYPTNKSIESKGFRLHSFNVNTGVEGYKDEVYMDFEKVGDTVIKRVYFKEWNFNNKCSVSATDKDLGQIKLNGSFNFENSPETLSDNDIALSGTLDIDNRSQPISFTYFGGD